MESEEELNLEIMELTMTIQEKYPELSEFLGEMPVSIPNTKNPEITIDNLKAYRDTLSSLLANYIREHANDDVHNLKSLIN